MSTQDKIQKLTETLLKLSSSVALSDAIDSDSDKNAGIAASPKAVSTLASVILEAAKNASEGSNGESDIHEPFLGEVQHEIGSWWFSIDGSIPAGGLPHLGHLVSRSAYGTGWTWIETNKTVISDEEWITYAESHNGTCPYYSYGDGSTTFRTPSYDQSFLKVLASISGAGSVEEAGMPNITGAFQARAINNMNMLSAYPSTNKSGVISYDGLNGSVWDYSCDAIQNTNGYKNAVISIDASRSSSIYGNSDTVTPQNYGIIVGIYLVGAVSATIGETDAAGLLNGLNTLETQVAGCVRTVNGLSASASGNVSTMPNWSAAVSKSVNTNYTAETDGFVFVFVNDNRQTVDGAFSFFSINGVQYRINHQAGAASSVSCGSCCIFPVSKGDVYICYPGRTGHNEEMKFIPCKGAV